MDDLIRSAISDTDFAFEEVLLPHPLNRSAVHKRSSDNRDVAFFDFIRLDFLSGHLRLDKGLWSI